LKKEDKEDTELLRRRMDRIFKKAGDDGATISKEVCDAFDKMDQLIRQVIEACKKCKNRVKKKNITDRIKKRIEETIRSKVEPKRERKNSFSGKLKKRKEI
jgi:hypothetical protein